MFSKLLKNKKYQIKNF